MSALGQKRTHAVQQTVELFDHFVGAVEEGAGRIPANVMSTLPPKADVCGATSDVCYGP
jgi:hypothetical protein